MNQRSSTIAVFANSSSQEIEDEIKSRVGNIQNTRLVIRKGDPTNPMDLQRTNLTEASSIIVLDPDGSGDATAISTILAIQAAAPESVVPVVVEIDDVTHGEALAQATGGRVRTVRSNEVIARVTAQASRQPGLAAVVLDLLDFEGDEIYFQSVPQTAGCTYREVITSFNSASVIGLDPTDKWF